MPVLSILSCLDTPLHTRLGSLTHFCTFLPGGHRHCLLEHGKDSWLSVGFRPLTTASLPPRFHFAAEFKPRLEPLAREPLAIGEGKPRAPAAQAILARRPTLAWFPGSRILSARRKTTSRRLGGRRSLGGERPSVRPSVSGCFCPEEMAVPEQPLPLPRGGPGSASLSPPRVDRTLLVRHLPAELTAEEKEDLLKYFGAQSVRVLSDKGRLKHTAFATFPNEKAAIKALTRLHQLKLLGHTLVVEFAKEQDRVHSPCPTSNTEKKKRSDDNVEDDKEKKEPYFLTIENGIAPNHGLTFPLNSCLKYMYPPPSSTILANIVNALASVPKFYVQVLHLMNKMNLPTPFGPITARPPMYEDYMPLHAPLPPTSPQPPEEPPLPDEDEDLSSKESEYESSDEEDRQRMNKLMELANLQPKRPKPAKPRQVRKKQKIKDMLNVPSSASHR
ncbi:RNA-binding region (RNP1 RRM) containing 3 [Cricetulus griseus]